THFACTACGHEVATWMGRCPGCGEWNTLVEEKEHSRPAASGRPGSRQAGRRGASSSSQAKPIALADVAAVDVERLPTGSDELDRVLGGGIVPGSIILIGGSPGIGKSTLMSSTLGALQEAGRRTLYVSGEESPAQIRLRAERLGPQA